MNEKMMVEFFKNSIEYSDAYVFYNISKELLMEIKLYLQSLQSFHHRSIVLDAGDFISKKKDFEKIASGVEKDHRELIIDQMYEFLIVTKVLRQLSSLGIDPYKGMDDLEGMEQILASKSYGDVCLQIKNIESLSIWFDLEKLGRQFKPIGINCIIPNEVSIDLQRNLNVLLDHRHYYQTTFLVEGDELASYYDAMNNCLKEPIHDYISHDLRNIKMKEFVKLIKK